MSSKKNKALKFNIIRDTREQKPLDMFTRKVIRKKLDTGDYSIEGHEDAITFEHKTIADLVGSCDYKQRERFKREYERMYLFDFAVVVIRGKEEDLLPYCRKLYKQQYPKYLSKAKMAKNKGYKPPRPPKRPEVRAMGVLGSMKQWRVRYGVHFYFIGSELETCKWVEEQMEYFVADLEDK